VGWSKNLRKGHRLYGILWHTQDYRPLSKQPNESKAPPAKEIQLLIPVRTGMGVSEAISPITIRNRLIAKTAFLGADNLMKNPPYNYLCVPHIILIFSSFLHKVKDTE